MKIEVCPGCLAESFNSYCNKCLKKLFSGIRINHVLNFSRAEFDKIKNEQSEKVSLPGKQVKHSLKIENKELIPGERGEYILKPVPSSDQIQNVKHAPSNEHVTMQIAGQAFGINTAVNGIIFFNNGEAAYFTKRFDMHESGNRLLQEDFAQIAGRTEEINGESYKYNYSCEEIAELMKKYLNAYHIEIEKFFKIIVFNFLFSNNDFHLKNLSLYRNEEYGDYLLAPAYDLSNTLIHSPDKTNFALNLFKEDSVNAVNGGKKYSQKDFIEFSQRIGIKEKRFNAIFTGMLSKSAQVKNLVSRSFLSEELKSVYLDNYIDKYEVLRGNIL
jgi:serine/threonine-protein kinase HipA